MTSNQPPPERYGRRARRGPRRWARRLMTGLALLLGATAALVGYANLGSPPLQGKAVAFRTLDESSVRITLQVRRDRPEQPAVCVVRARAISGREVGRREVLIPPGSRPTYLETVLTTSARPVTGEVFGCSYEVPEYLTPTPRPSG